jgi:hypothetical protein
VTHKLAIARPLRGHPRFFDGTYDGLFSIGTLSPNTTGAPDKAKTYDDEVVARLITSFLNVLEGIHTGTNAAPWIIMPLPEEWLK